jgi:hypothetical protein
VPVAFGLGNLYESSAVHYGLLGAAVLAGAVIVLVVIGSDSRELRGVGAAAALAAVVLLVPLVLALLGEDYYIPRALMPAWIPLAVVVAAACTAPRARVAGAVLAAILLASFVYAQVKINDSPQYQRPDWRGVAAALGSAGRRVTRHRSTRDLPSARPLEPACERLGDGRRGRCRRLPLADARAPAARRRTPDLVQGRQ